MYKVAFFNSNSVIQSNKLQLAKAQLYPLGFNYSGKICNKKANEVNGRKTSIFEMRST